MDLPLETPNTDETSFVPGPDVQCGDTAGLVPLTLTLTAAATRDNPWLTPIVSLDGYDLSFTHAPCP